MMMAEFKFNFDWEGPVSSSDKLSQATMARLELRVGDRSAISVLDRRTKSYRETVIVPLLPLAEWLVSNWWFLWHEVEDLQHEQRGGFESRHDFAYAGDGFVYPSVQLLPLGDQVQIRSGRRKFAHAPLEFLDMADRVVQRDEIEIELRRLVDVVIDRLRELGYADTSLEEEWSALNELDDEEREYCQAAALLGLDPFEVNNGLSEMIVRLWNESEPMLREDLFASADSEGLPAVKEWIEASLNKVEKNPSSPQWAELRRRLSEPAVTPRPWDRGYDLARQARREMGVPNGRFEFQEFGKWAINAIDAEVPTPRIDGLVARNAPSCLIRSKRESGRRFLLARAVGEYLGRANGSPSLLTSLSSVRQRQSRAFAAEFLAPSDELRNRLGDRAAVVSEDAIDELAEDFGVSGYVIRHQIENHNLATFIDVE